MTTEKGTAMKTVQATSFLTASRDSFLDSQANGIQACSVNGSLSLGTWLRPPRRVTGRTRSLTTGAPAAP